MRVYAQIDGKLAAFDVGTSDVGVAQVQVRLELARIASASRAAVGPRVFAVIGGGSGD